MTRTALLIASLVCAAAPALAQPAGGPPPAPVAKMVPPTGWTADLDGAARIITAVGGESPFVGVPVGVDAQVWRAPSGTAALITTQVVTESLPSDPDAAATLALHDVRAGADAVDGAVVSRFEVVVDPAGKLHEARLEWSDPSVATTTVTRALVFRAGGALVRASGECVLAADAGAARAACEAFLASMQPSSAQLEPVRVSATPPPPGAAGEPPPAGAGEPRPSGSPPPGGPAPTTISARDGEIPATLAIRPAPATTDKRPYYMIGGLLVLGLVFWWNKRERDRREAAERLEERKRERAARKDRTAAADADGADAADADGDADDADDADDAGADKDDAAADADHDDAADAKRAPGKDGDA